MGIDSYKSLMAQLAAAYPGYTITMGATNELCAPAIIVTLSNVASTYADNQTHIVSSAEYSVTFYVPEVSEFDPWPAARMFGNLQQGAIDAEASGELFQSTVRIIGANCLWHKV